MIEINNLVKRYGNTRAVNGISFTVNDGEVLGFLGPNGAGKSTTMNIITGYLSSTSGSVLVDGHDILEDPVAAKKNIGYLPELPPLYFDMTVREYLNFVCDLKKVPSSERKAQINKILSMVHITDYADRLIGNLSKGYKQRVGMAQAMVGDPKILILDEPTVGLDPTQIQEIRKLIRALAQNHTIIFSSHILSEVQEVCDRVVIINNGKVAAVQPISDLSKKLSGYTRLLLSFSGSIKDVTNALRSIRGITSVTERVSNVDIHEVEISVDSSTDVRSSIFYTMVRGNWPILELRSLDPTLEELFLSITSGKQGGK